MFKLPLLLAFFILASIASDVIKTPKGFFIKGRGCGTNVEFKYLAAMPLDLTGHECSFVGEEYVKFRNQKLAKGK